MAHLKKLECSNDLESTDVPVDQGLDNIDTQKVTEAARESAMDECVPPAVDKEDSVMR